MPNTSLATVPSQEELKDLFTFELCSYPLSLFDTSALSRVPAKPRLADKLWNLSKQVSDTQPSESSTYFLDGGSLLQRDVWHRDKSNDELCIAYVSHVEKRYGKNAIIV